MLEQSNSLTIKDAGFDEAWLQQQIWNNPQIIGLGELESIAKEKIISSGGRLDILLGNTNGDTMYEVEVQLGDTDPSHIMRTIEYWDLIRKKYPQRNHYGVLIAEKITRRFFNVIQLVSSTIPIIAIQCQIIEISGKRSLVFTTILDCYEETDELTEGVNEIVDEAYWKKKSEPVLNAAKRLYEITKEVYQDTAIEFCKGNVSLKSNGYNQLFLKKRSGDSVLIVMRHGSKRDEMVELIETAGIPVEEKKKQVRFIVPLKKLKSYEELIIGLAKQNKRWWIN